MDVKDETTGTVTRWAILISSGMSAEDLTSAMKLTVGTSVTVSGIGARDGTRRLSLTGQPSGTINGQQVPQQ
jgi:sRNA-binding protein